MKHKDRIFELREQGLSYSNIQKELGCSKGTIAYHLGEGQKEKSLSRGKAGVSKVRRFLQEYKQNAGCTDCKEDYPYYVLEFDHLGDKDFNIGSFQHHTVDMEKVKAEIAKCEVVCSNCHKIRTYNRLNTSGKYSINVDSSYLGD
jgi:transposase